MSGLSCCDREWRPAKAIYWPCQWKLDEPFRWRFKNLVPSGRPARVEVVGLFQTSAEQTNEKIAAAFGMMLATPHHYLVVADDIERAADWFGWADGLRSHVIHHQSRAIVAHCMVAAGDHVGSKVAMSARFLNMPPDAWERRSIIVATKVSTDADMDTALKNLARLSGPRALLIDPIRERVSVGLRSICPAVWGVGSNPVSSLLNWILVAGDGRPYDNAEPTLIESIGSVVTQAHEVGIPVYVDRIGSRVYSTEAARLYTKYRYGGSKPESWPLDKLGVKTWAEARQLPKWW